MKRHTVLNTNIANRIGDYAEFLFDANSVLVGLIVNRPIHPGTVYDRVVEYGGKFSRVQIKCVTKARQGRGSYRAILTKSNSSIYKKSEVDYFAVYVMPEESWYIFPNEEKSTITFNGKNHSKFKNNWEVLKCSRV